MKPTWTCGPTLQDVSGCGFLLRCKAFLPGTHYSSHSEKNLLHVSDCCCGMFVFLFVFFRLNMELRLPTLSCQLPHPPTTHGFNFMGTFLYTSQNARGHVMLKINILLNLVFFFWKRDVELLLTARHNRKPAIYLFLSNHI